MTTQFKRIEHIENSSVLTPFQKEIETILFTKGFTLEMQHDIFRLLGKFYDKNKSQAHWMNDAYLNSLMSEFDNIKNKLNNSPVS